MFIYKYDTLKLIISWRRWWLLLPLIKFIRHQMPSCANNGSPIYNVYVKCLIKNSFLRKYFLIS